MPYADPMKRRQCANASRRRAYRRWEAEYIQRQRRAVFAILGEVCVRCGWSDRRALQVDHVKGLEGKKRLSQKLLYCDVLRNPSRYQLLCANHNWIKRYENNEVRGSRNGE